MADDTVISFEAILRELVEQGGFQAATLVTGDGLPLAMAAPESAGASPGTYDEDELAAMVSLVRDVVDMAQGRLGMGAVDEVSVVTDDRLRLACRYFTAGDEAMILAVVASPRQTYRRLTNQAIRATLRCW